MELSFEQWLYLLGRHKNTVKLHLKILRVIERQTKEMTYDECCALLGRMKAAGLSNATLNHYVGTMRLWGKYKNLPEFEQLKFYKKHPGLKGTFSDDEVEAFINLPCPPKSDKKAWELWSLYFETLAYTGARPGEVAQITINDIDHGRNSIIFKYTKTDVPRTVAMAPRLSDKLKDHVQTCENFLFVTRKGQVFSEAAWYHAFLKRKTLLGIKRCNITPMSFRHSFATRMLEKDVNIYKVAKILGHDIKMTQQYEHLTVEDIKTAMQSHPLIKKQIIYSKEEITKVIAEVLNDIGLSYDIYSESEVVHLDIRCP
jgi:integrase